MSDAPKFKGEYGTSERGNFSVVDTIGVPHAYCITPKHLAKSTGIYHDIEEAERGGAVCDTCRRMSRKNGSKILSYKEHEMALLVRCLLNPSENDEAKEELRAWFVKIKDEVSRNNYAGFVLLRAW